MLAHFTRQPAEPPSCTLLRIGIRRFSQALEHPFYIALEEVYSAALGGMAALVSNRFCRKILVGKTDDVQHQRRTRKLLQKRVLPDHVAEGRKPTAAPLQIAVYLVHRQR